MGDALIDRLKARATASFEANKSFGRRGKEWAIETEVEWQAASRISELEAKLATASTVLRECLGVFGASNFTDRGGYADMIRQALASIQERT